MSDPVLDQQHVSEVADKPQPSTAAEESAGLGDGIQSELLDSVVFNWLPDWLQTPLETLALYPLLLVLILVIGAYLLGKFMQMLVAKVGGRIAGKTKNDFDDQLIRILGRPALTTPVILGLFLVTALLPLPSGMHGFTVGLLTTILVLSWLRAALKGTHVLLEIIASREGKHEIVQPRTIPMFEISMKLILVALGGYILLLVWGVNPTAWLASAGVIGIAVGFAARDTLANLFSGIFIVADAPYKMGDYIVLDTGERGEVTAVGMRSTRLLTRDDIEVTVPNAIIANAKIINESGGPWEKHRIRIPVGVAYGSDLDQVTALLSAIADENEEVLAHPVPRVRMRKFNTSSLDFELLGWIEKPELRGRVMHELLMTIYRRFNEEGVRIPFPQTDIHVRTLPEDRLTD